MARWLLRWKKQELDLIPAVLIQPPQLIAAFISPQQHNPFLLLYGELLHHPRSSQNPYHITTGSYTKSNQGQKISGVYRRRQDETSHVTCEEQCVLKA